MSRTNRAQELLCFFIDIENENVATAIDINACLKCQVNLEDKKLHTYDTLREKYFGGR